MLNNFKAICDRVVDGETVIVSRPNNENVVVLSEREYNNMQKAAHNAAYMVMIDKSIEELEHGGFVIKTLDELWQMELCQRQEENADNGRLTHALFTEQYTHQLRC